MLCINVIRTQDEVPQVREIFSAKLHKGLSQPLPGRCLPLDFMGIYSLAGLEQDKKLKGCIKKMMVSDICKRREYAKSLTFSTTGSKFLFLILEKMLRIRTCARVEKKH